MKKNHRGRTISIRLVAAACSLAVGVLIAAQWRSLPIRATNPIAPYASLKETRDALYEEQNSLKDTIKELQKSIAKAQDEQRDATIDQKQLNELQMKKAQAGLTKLNGPGVIITYDDSKSADLTEESIVHAADLRDTINLLWGSGAEAISINGQRVVINTAIDCIVNTILVNNTRISNPFRVEAIGNRELMYERLINPTVLSNIHKRKQENGLIFQVETNNDITVPVFDGSFETKGATL